MESETMDLGVTQSSLKGAWNWNMVNRLPK